MLHVFSSKKMPSYGLSGCNNKALQSPDIHIHISIYSGPAWYLVLVDD